jgi:hypothetical protein
MQAITHASIAVRPSAWNIGGLKENCKILCRGFQKKARTSAYKKLGLKAPQKWNR